MFASIQRCAHQNASSAVALQPRASGFSRGAVSLRAAGRDAALHEQTANVPVIGCLARSPGQSLDKSTRRAMESQFGHDFSKVRVHTDVEAASAAKQLNARAFTVAKDIYFGSHAFSPHSLEGNRLLMHELVHTLQQSSGENLALQTSLDVSHSGDPAEVEADRIVHRLSSQCPQVLSHRRCPSLQRVNSF